MKKVLSISILIFSVCFIVWGWKYIDNSGLLKGCPDVVYMDSSQLELRQYCDDFTEKEQAIYTALYNGVGQGLEKIPLPFEINGSDYENIYLVFEKQESQFFYISSDFYTSEKVREAKIIYRDENADFEKQSTELQNVVSKIISNDVLQLSDYQKILFVHNYLIDNCVYMSNVSDYLSTAYGCIINGKANCEGYSKAFDYFMDYMQIPSVLLVGDAVNGENHAWNQVQINHNWYNIDVTWDDTDVAGERRYAYFLKEDCFFLRSHSVDSAYLNGYECNNSDFDYHIKNDLFIQNQDDMDRILKRELNSINNVIELQFNNIELYNDFKSNYFQNKKVFDVLKQVNSSLDYSKSVNCSLVEDEFALILYVYLSQ